MKIRFALAMLGGLIAATSSQASTIDAFYDLDLNGMSSGTCPGGVCGTVHVLGDTTTSLTFTVDLATNVSFHANHSGASGTGNFFYFKLTQPGGTGIAFSSIGDSGTIGPKSYSYNAPTFGSFTPNPGNFPGQYDYAASCTNNTSGKICNDLFHFTASITDPTHPMVIGDPLGHGLFPTDHIAFVADLSIAAGTATCAGSNACTGLVGSTLAPAVPEPATWAMMLLGFAGLSFAQASAGTPSGDRCSLIDRR